MHTRCVQGRGEGGSELLRTHALKVNKGIYNLQTMQIQCTYYALHTSKQIANASMGGGVCQCVRTAYREEG